MRCIVCDQNDWENVDEYRELKKHDGEPVGMAMCKNCGFVSYPTKYKTKEEIKNYYRTEYRSGPPTFNNFVTGERKLQYHQHFLKEVFMKWNDNKTSPVVGEVGAAIGMTLNMIRQIFPKAEVHGTEWDVNHRQVAFHEFGIRLGEELPQDRKYDLIMTYKVAEHQMDVDQELKQYHDLLQDDGYLYISVPIWFKSLENFGVGGFDLEYYYHPAHINVWTKKLFEAVLKKAGFQIIKYDDYMYGDTYLCKKCEPAMVTQDDVEKPDDIKAVMARVKKAAECFRTNKFEEAIEQWPNFPLAWAGLYEFTRKELHQKHQGNGNAILKDLIPRMKEACGDHPEVDRLHSDIAMRYGLFDKAAEVMDRSLQKRPNFAGTLLQLSHCFRKMADQVADPDKRMELRLTARDICRRVAQIDRQAQKEAVNWSLVDSTQIAIDDFIEFAQRKQPAQKGDGNGKSV